MSRMQPLQSRQSGLSIIELMIALLLGSLLTVGLVQIFTSNSQAFRMSEAVARSQEYGRIASEMLSRETRGAGYYGCNSQNAVNNLDISPGDDDWDLYNYTSGDAVSSDEAWRPAGTVNNTDFLHFSGMESSGIEITASQPPTAASTKVSSRSGKGPASELQDDDIIAITDCQGTDVVQISNIQGDGDDLEVTLVTNSGSGSPGNNFDSNVCSSTGNAGAGNNCLSNDYGIGAQILKPYKRTYFIGESTVRAGESALKMVEYVRDSQRTLEMVEGVIDMQVRYGFSSEPDQAVSKWEDAESVANSEWNQVRAVRVSLLVRGGPDKLFDDKATVCFPAWTDCSGGDNFTAPDNRMYRVYSFTTNVRNSSS
ncbi:PilW family protein [Marinobacter sp. ATCH36]|uniref:PilW family protein n=1 Tax=Marinobacter sp. ATCH36 TaxID=2945106 RepID=UPI002020BE53|nr:PilW family protein [Marinobacter sp. ATCH36]MCL7945877.1 PilW family protein [Marinobacter sp. ATCH36]